ncbi:MAG: hypothetical protein ACETVY_02330 [Candidatus Bathyarchaeia archaeon]
MSRSVIEKTSRMTGLLFIVLSIGVMGVSAYVYQQASQMVTQTIVEVATIALKDTDLGTIKEGETKTYTKNEVANLGDAINIVTTEVQVYLYLVSNLDTQSSRYSTYDISVKFNTIPGGSSHFTGDIACVLSIGSPVYGPIDLDVAGSWSFDFELTTTTKSVDLDTVTTVIITVLAESPT